MIIESLSLIRLVFEWIAYDNIIDSIIIKFDKFIPDNPEPNTGTETSFILPSILICCHKDANATCNLFGSEDVFLVLLTRVSVAKTVRKIFFAALE